MSAMWLCLRSATRLRWRGLLTLALLAGLIGGIALTAAAGARRTDTAYQRLLRRSSASQLLVTPAVGGFHGFFRALARLPQVQRMSTTAFYDIALIPPGRAGRHEPVRSVVFEGSPDGATGISVDRVRVVSGRLFNARDASAVMIDEKFASSYHLHPGSTLSVLAYRQSATHQRQGRPVRLAFTVSAVVTFDDEVVPATRALAEPAALLSPGFARTAAAQSYNPGGGAANVLLRPGASEAAITRAAKALGTRYQVGGVGIVNLATQYAATQRAIRPQAVALAIFAALAGLIGLAIIVQLLSRQLALDGLEFPILRALGMSRVRLAAASLARAAIVTTIAGATAVAVAIAASPLMPIGPARVAEPSPGIEVNLAVLGAGFAAIMLLPLLLLGPDAWRTASRTAGPLGIADLPAPEHQTRLGPVLRALGSVAGSIGVPMALEPGHGRTAVPVRSALVGTTVAVASVVAAFVFGSNLVGLVGTPHRYGQNWGLDLDLQVSGVPIGAAMPVLNAAPGLAGYAAGTYGQLAVDGARVPAIGLDQMRGHGFLTMLAGHPPDAPDQIVLGVRTLALLHKRVGQTVSVGGSQLSIVGSAVFASFSVAGGSATDLGSGAAVVASVLSRPNPPFCLKPTTCYNFFLLRFRPGADLGLASARLERAVTRAKCPPGLCLVTRLQTPADIQNYKGVRDTPFVLGLVLSVLAVGTLSHVLFTAVFRRRRDLAVLKTLGMRRYQLLGVVAWQASALAVAAVIIGIPLGTVAGRWIWAAFAGSVGIATGASIPVLIVLSVIPCTLLLANALAAVPAWTAARIRPAAALRTE
jgi:hypothetical protein